jgi:sugar/nucleoside kinase (ribokinase family)
VTTFLDTAWDAQNRWLELIGPYLPYVDYMVPSLSEARAITGRDEPAEIAYSLIEMGAGTVAIKMGAEGCLVMSGDGLPHRFPAYEVDVVDATGAGDAFAAGFIAGVYMDWPLDQTADLANALGALCVTAMGAQGRLGSMEDTLVFMSA